jgi:hypothetical protein
MRLFLAEHRRVYADGSGIAPRSAGEQRVESETAAPQRLESETAARSFGAPAPSTDASAVPTTIIPLLICFYDMVISDCSSFGVYCRAWLGAGAGACTTGRNRDIFPLPLMESVMLPPTLDIDSKVFMNTCNLAVLALNFLWDDCPSVATPPRMGALTSAQAKVHTHVQG